MLPWSGRRFGVVGLPTAILLIHCVILRASFACPYSVRDVGFVELKPSRYMLYCLVRDDTPDREKTESTLEELSGIVLLDSNVAGEVVNVDQQDAHPATEYNRFWDIKTYPAAILVSPDGRSLILPMARADEPFKETAWSVLGHVASSPKRGELIQHIARAWCIVLLVEGRDPAENKRAREAVTEAIAIITGSTTAMGRVVHEPPHLIVVSPESFPEEEVLLWSLGLDDHGDRGPRVAVLYGRGRQMGPVLEGDNLTRDSVLNLLYVIGMDCGCQTDRRLLTGRVIPLTWGSTVHAVLVGQLGFDPESPMVKTEVSQIWSGGATYAEGPLGYSEGVFGYTEQPLDPESAPAGDVVSGSPTTSVPTFGKRAERTVLFIGGALTLLVLIGGGLIVVVRAR